jgi:transposase
VCRLEPLLPDRTPRRGGRWADHRMVINGVFRRARWGCHRGTCRRYGHWKTVYNRHRRWSVDGNWERILDELNPRRGQVYAYDLICHSPYDLTQVGLGVLSPLSA